MPQSGRIMRLGVLMHQSPLRLCYERVGRLNSNETTRRGGYGNGVISCYSRRVSNLI
jgi:hypothetical protein